MPDGRPALSRDHVRVLDADAVSREMHDRVRRDAALLRTAVRRFLARGRIARLIACLVVGFAAVVIIVVIGVAVDYLLFGQLDRRIRRRRGLLIET